MVQIRGKQRTDMGYDLVNILTIRADEPSEKNIIVPNPHLASLTDQALHQMDLRALAKIVGSRFETQSQHGDVLLFRAQNDFDRPIQMRLIAGQDRREKWQF